MQGYPVNWSANRNINISNTYLSRIYQIQSNELRKNGIKFNSKNVIEDHELYYVLRQAILLYKNPNTVLMCFILFKVNFVCEDFQSCLVLNLYTRSLRKVSDLVVFCENLVDCNETHFHEMTLNLHMHVWIFFPPVNRISWWQAAFEWCSV